MIKGVQVTATNTASIDAGTGATTLLTVPVGKTFILTDLIMSLTYTGAQVSFTSGGILRLVDANVAAAACTSTTGSGVVYATNLPLQASGTTAIWIQDGSLQLHFPVNGPEFQTGCTPILTTEFTPVSTGCLWISGIYK